MEDSGRRQGRKTSTRKKSSVSNGTSIGSTQRMRRDDGIKRREANRGGEESFDCGHAGGKVLVR
jgi:hypothetical protein